MNEDPIVAEVRVARDAIARECVATDREIDILVYELYGLSTDEIKIVEESAGG